MEKNTKMTGILSDEDKQYKQDGLERIHKIILEIKTLKGELEICKSLIKEKINKILDLEKLLPNKINKVIEDTHAECISCLEKDAEIITLKESHKVIIHELTETHTKELDQLKNNELTFATKISSLEEELKKDPLTQIFNRQVYDNVYRNATNEAREKPDRIFSAAIIDIDNFKSINDSYGHDIGDQVLIKLSQILQKYIKELNSPNPLNKNGNSISLVARYGGEEFTVLIKRKIDPLISMLNGALADFSKVKFQTTKGILTNVTYSVGIGQYNKEEDQKTNTEVDTLFHDIDSKLYYAKKNGKNRIVSQIF